MSFCYIMKVQTYEESLMKYHEYVIAKQLHLIVPPILLFVGTFGNLLSFYILMKNVKKASTYTYLSALALMDLFVLYIGLFRLWMGQIVIDVADTNDLICKFAQFLGYFSSDASVWIIVAVTIERALVVTFPLKAPRLCSTRNARIGVGIILVIFIVINCHFLWTVELIQYSYNDTIVAKCQAKENYTHLLDNIWPWVDAAIYSFVPFIIIIVLNSIIVKNIISSKRKREDLRQYSISSTNATVGRRHEDGTGSKVTIMLLAVSFTFLITTIPMNIVLIYASFADNKGNGNDQIIARRKLVDTVAEMLMFTNHSINFFLYCATGRKFRDQFKLLISRCFCSKVFLPRYSRNSRRTTIGSYKACKIKNSKLHEKETIGM